MKTFHYIKIRQYKHNGEKTITPLIASIRKRDPPSIKGCLNSLFKCKGRKRLADKIKIIKKTIQESRYTKVYIPRQSEMNKEH